jgi:thioredoxin-dependent peroxiredoxin
MPSIVDESERVLKRSPAETFGSSRPRRVAGRRASRRTRYAHPVRRETQRGAVALADTRHSRTTPTGRRFEEGAIVVVEGKPAPDFTLTSDSGEPITLSSFRGRPVVLYFYPQDDTTGCTTQACGIRDDYSAFELAGAVVLGVSPDTVGSHVKFKQKYALPFILLADPEHEVAESYGAWGEKSRNGRTYLGIVRSTFVIAPDGTVTKVMRNVKPETHANDVLAALATQS